MCRVFGCVAPEPVSIRHELLEAENPVIRPSEHDDSGWGMAVYERAEGGAPALFRFPETASGDAEAERADRRDRADLQRARAPRHARRPDAGEHPSVRARQLLASATTAP